jgi:DNA repair ATPase RecN
MESLARFNQMNSDIQGMTETLNKEKAKFQRQLNCFEDDLERSQIVGDQKGIVNATKGINIITEKLTAINDDLSKLNLSDYALAVFQEAEEGIRDIHDCFQSQWENIIEARIKFLNELEKLGAMRRNCQRLCWATMEPAKVLRRNPLDAPHISGQHNLVVDLSLLNKCLNT